MNYQFHYETAIGPLFIFSDGESIVRISFGPDVSGRYDVARHEEIPPIRRAFDQISEYLAGRRREFDLPLKAAGTDFQRKVWEVLSSIPYGERRSYKQVAAQVGNPRAVRAVGMANNRNPLPIVVPCHRVVGSDGKLVGYAGGLGIKEFLLGLESREGI